MIPQQAQLGADTKCGSMLQGDDLKCPGKPNRRRHPRSPKGRATSCSYFYAILKRDHQIDKRNGWLDIGIGPMHDGFWGG